jgi:hypothetical protein
VRGKAPRAPGARKVAEAGRGAIGEGRGARGRCLGEGMGLPGACRAAGRREGAAGGHGRWGGAWGRGACATAGQGHGAQGREPSPGRGAGREEGREREGGRERGRAHLRDPYPAITVTKSPRAQRGRERGGREGVAAWEN